MAESDGCAPVSRWRNVFALPPPEASPNAGVLDSSYNERWVTGPRIVVNSVWETDSPDLGMKGFTT